MDLTKEILFNEVEEAESEIRVQEEIEAPNNDLESKAEQLSVNYELEEDEIVIEHCLDTLIISTKKLKDLTLKGILTKFKDNLSLVPKISSDFLTVYDNNTEVSLNSKVEAGHYYTVYTDHQVKG